MYIYVHIVGIAVSRLIKDKTNLTSLTNMMKLLLIMNKSIPLKTGLDLIGE